MTYSVVNDKCLEAMRQMEECSVDALVCDGPYAISFMGSKWDSFGRRTGNETVTERKKKAGDYAIENKGAPRYGNSHGHAPDRNENVAFQEAMTPVFGEALRVAKPGAYLLAFGSPRTFHRLACAIEDAGWMPRDTIMWVYSQGYPKGLNVSKAFERRGDTELAERWAGWNSQLKPAFEPILVAQKPLDGTIVHNVSEWGVGAMNIDACRVPSEPYDASRDGEATADKDYRDSGVLSLQSKPGPRGGDPKGRFPANLVHDGSEEVRACFPDAKGQQGDLRAGIPKRTGVCYGDFPPTNEHTKRVEYDTSAARFFYCAKATKKDRNSGGVTNDHVSVKPNALMRWLVRLVCPQGGMVLDPFMGSGSTGVACMQEGMSFVGVEMDPHYCDIAKARIDAAFCEQRQMELPL